MTPFCNYGSLSGVCARTVFTERMVAYVIAKIIPALHELHKNQIAHRDLKSDNVLVDENFDIFLSDLGFCDIIDEKTKTCPDKGVIGTPYWMAPEGKFYFLQCLLHGKSFSVNISNDKKLFFSFINFMLINNFFLHLIF